MPTPAIRPSKPHPILVLRAAVEWARARQVPVRLGVAWGVHCVSSHDGSRWEMEPAARAVDPIGAAILERQPMATERYAAAAEALSAPAAWIHGLQEALDDEHASESWGESIHRALYAAGREAGELYRRDFTRQPRTVH